MESSLRIVAITNCPAGIAHTYMVAEALEQKARSLGHTIKVETQGSSGVENRLSSEEIAAADYVILATGRGLRRGIARRLHWRWRQRRGGHGARGVPADLPHSRDYGDAGGGYFPATVTAGRPQTQGQLGA